MSNPYDDYQIDIVDVSRWQDDLTTPFKPDILKLMAAGFMAIIVRVGLGRVKDALFDWFWSQSKGRLARLSYWYGDYYSHRTLAVPVSDRAWGIEQGTNWANFMKGDWGEGKGFLDCEPSGGHPIGILNRKSYNEIMRPLAETYDALTGGVCGIYCSVGFIPNLYEWARKRTLYVAWYDRSKTKEQIIAACRKAGWLGEIVIWQYASDGDINMDGIGDGKTLGMETAALDLNAWLGTPEEWSRFLGSTPPIIPPPTEDPEPPVFPVPPGSTTKIIEFKTVIELGGLNVRNTPIGTYGSTVEKWMPVNTDIPILETMILGANIWHRIGYKQWCAERYNGTTFLK